MYNEATISLMICYAAPQVIDPCTSRSLHKHRFGGATYTPVVVFSALYGCVLLSLHHAVRLEYGVCSASALPWCGSVSASSWLPVMSAMDWIGFVLLGQSKYSMYHLVG
jgi:hypothetical protein